MPLKDKLYRVGSISMIVLGVLHTLYFIFSVLNEEPIIYETLTNVTKKGIVWFLGERSLLSYYNGYSLSMGLLLMNYGLLTLVAKRTYKAVVLSMITSFIAFVISFVYFHILACSLMVLSFIFYSLALMARNR